MAIRIYTKTGDAGTTALFGGSRVPKSHYRIEAYGNVDELNAHLGMLRDVLQPYEDLRDFLKAIQDNMLVAGAMLATEPGKPLYVPQLKEQDIEQLETAIDEMEKSLPPLKHFILPGGHVVVSHCHLARTVCRRAERGIVALDLEEPVDGVLIRYFNRLSDYLFVLGRYTALLLGVEEVVWIPQK